MYDEALESVLSVLRVDPVNIKALYRCGKVYLIKGELDDAIKTLQMAANLNPEEKVCLLHVTMFVTFENRINLQE